MATKKNTIKNKNASEDVTKVEVAEAKAPEAEIKDDVEKTSNTDTSQEIKKSEDRTVKTESATGMEQVNQNVKKELKKTKPVRLYKKSFADRKLQFSIGLEAKPHLFAFDKNGVSEYTDDPLVIERMKEGHGCTIFDK
jgi:hypothetical protein